jgi:hypothetical protein
MRTQTALGENLAAFLDITKVYLERVGILNIHSSQLDFHFKTFSDDLWILAFTLA